MGESLSAETTGPPMKLEVLCRPDAVQRGRPGSSTLPLPALVEAIIWNPAEQPGWRISFLNRKCLCNAFFGLVSCGRELRLVVLPLLSANAGSGRRFSGTVLNQHGIVLLSLVWYGPGGVP